MKKLKSEIKTNINNLDNLLYKINLNIKDTYDSFWKEMVKETIVINYYKNISLEELINKIENKISFKNKDKIDNSIIMLTISTIKEIYTII